MNIDYEKLSSAAVGEMLNGFGVNLLVRQIAEEIKFLQNVFAFAPLRQDENYALLRHREQFYQLHADSTYASHPLYAMLPQMPPRGVGVELQLYQTDPDAAEMRAKQFDYHILQPALDKPHGLRECFLLDPNGYCWVPSRRLAGGD